MASSRNRKKKDVSDYETGSMFIYPQGFVPTTANMQCFFEEVREARLRAAENASQLDAAQRPSRKK